MRFVQEVRRFEKRLLIGDGAPNEIPPKGREFIWVDTTARWRIADARKFLENGAMEAGARSRLDDIIDSVVRDQVSASELVELVRSASWVVPEGPATAAVPTCERQRTTGRRPPTPPAGRGDSRSRSPLTAGRHSQQRSARRVRGSQQGFPEAQARRQLRRRDPVVNSTFRPDGGRRVQLIRGQLGASR